MVIIEEFLDGQEFIHAFCDSKLLKLLTPRKTTNRYATAMKVKLRWHGDDRSCLVGARRPHARRMSPDAGACKAWAACCIGLKMTTSGRKYWFNARFGDPETQLYAYSQTDCSIF
jgi:hypothetical protein